MVGRTVTRRELLRMGTGLAGGAAAGLGSLGASMHTARTTDAYGVWFAAAEAAKARGDWAGMEAALLRALRQGAGDEYAWRSLAWAQMLQGKWRDSLASARRNIARNGETSWSLAQLHESAMAAGDVGLAGRALDAELRLPVANRDRDLTAERAAFRAATHSTLYELSWRLRPREYRVQSGEVVINTPYRRHLWQSASLRVEGARTCRTETIDGRDVMFVDPGGADEVTLRARVTHQPAVRGGAFAERTTGPGCPPSMTSLLGRFRNRVDYDPSDPELRRVVKPLADGRPGERVQAILDWIAANIRYEDGYPDDLASILKSRKGVCHHQSNLMVAMCRAAGVPALVAHGVRLPSGAATFTDVMASHGWVEVYLDSRWVGVEPLNPHSLRAFGSGYLAVDATGRGVGNDHFEMYTPDGRRIEGIQGVPVSGTARILD